MTDLEQWALACLKNLRDRDLIKESDGDHCQEVEELITHLEQNNDR
jgi:hypothetical protein